ncbi:hypothetical protein TrRE_jg1992 [Triparma retinervis]|uniref:Uncharacterized protein n=1 Tax=Triparma retinervis TaxID=2557542 RepID=A0A9W7FAA8_9STRA|nr:hypothetical protein TrRE_jg1992 [Triparma retinervis]
MPIELAVSPLLYKSSDNACNINENAIVRLAPQLSPTNPLIAFPRLVPATAQAATLALKLADESPSAIRSLDTVVISATGRDTLADDIK